MTANEQNELYIISRREILGYLETKINNSESERLTLFTFEMLLIITICLFLLSGVDLPNVATAVVVGLILTAFGILLILVIGQPMLVWINRPLKDYHALRMDIYHQEEHVDSDEKATVEYVRLLERYQP